MELLAYNIRTTAYDTTQNITLDTFSNGITVKNSGNSLLLFSNDVLQPGASKAIGGNKGEILKARLQISFQTPPVVPPGYVQQDQAIVTEKFYLPEAHLPKTPNK